MRKRNWATFGAGALCLYSCLCLWSCASNTCDAECTSLESDESTNATSTSETRVSDRTSGNVSAHEGTNSDVTRGSTANTLPPNEDSDATQSDDSSDSSEGVDDGVDDGVASNEPMDTSQQSDATDAADTTDEGSDTSTDTSVDTATGSSITSDDNTSTPVGPEDPTSDSASRLKSVPVGSSDATLGYWEYLPPNYEAGPAPLLVFTHGASWQGDGSEEALSKLLTVGPVNLLSENKWPNSRPFVVLAPQNSHSGCFRAEDIDGFYRYALATYDIDPGRIYHTGQSCGAIGGWNYLAAHLDEFVTAAVLISGDGQDAFAQAGCDLGRVAIWGLHNEKDSSVNSAGTINPIMDLMLCEPVPDVKLTIYPDATEHDAWTKTYDLSAGHDIYAWLLQHTHR